MKALGLHGREQTGEILRSRMQACKLLPVLTTWCSRGGGLVLPDGPGRGQGGGEGRSWEGDDGTWDWTELDALREREGPFDVLVGFSQGAAGVLALAGRAGWAEDVGVVVAVAPSWEGLRRALGTNGGVRRRKADKCVVLCFAGATDALVPVSDCEKVVEDVRPWVAGVELVVHPGNHVIPGAVVTPVAKALEALSRRPRSQGVEDAQREEVEALMAIYGPENVLVAAAVTAVAPAREEKACPSVTVTCGDFSLEFDLTRNYPDLGGLVVRVASAPPGRTRAIAAAAQATVARMVGQPCMFDVIQAAMEASASKEVETPAVMEEEDEEKEKDDDDGALAQRALDEIRVKKFSWRDDTVTTDAGQWNFVVGIIGKPSAGKSTFFNTVTRVAQLASESDRARKSAAVGAAPFTTILPNFGEAMVRVQGHRLRVEIKDVAGLVPGAYQGRGKGNAFLNDLLDASALVHVVDGSGSAEPDGVLRQDGTHDLQAPARDAFWVLREVHMWISGNVLAKWPTGNKSAVVHSSTGGGSGAGKSNQERVTKLFTGYHATPSVVHKAARLAGLDLDRAPASWSRADVHRLVAHFILVRFPVVIALNKCDLLSRGEIEEVVRDVRATGHASSVVVPMSCYMENVLQEGEVGTVDPGVVSATVRARDEKLGEAGTGVEDALSAAVEARSPVLVTVVPAAVGPAGSPAAEPLRLLFKRGSTVMDVFDVLCRMDVLGGDFIRCEAWESVSAWAGGRTPGRVVGRDALVRDVNVLHVVAKRKVKWQQT